MSNRVVEKLFLYLLAISFLLHAAVFLLVTFIPPKQPPVPSEPVMVELRELPEPKSAPGREEKEASRLAEERRRVPRETAPRGERERDRIASIPRPPTPVVPQQKRGGGLQPQEGGEPLLREPPRGESLKRPEKRAPEMSRLFPSAEKMAKLEESYRKKYGPEVEEGETRFLNTDDMLFGSFLRRFETAVYGVWRYPPEAARLGVEGVTPVKITFNRRGEIEKVEILESSGSRILDDEVLRTLRLIGPVGSFPRGYEKEQFNLIAFFQYGIVRGGSRTLH